MRTLLLLAASAADEFLPTECLMDFIHDDFLLNSGTSRRFYHGYAAAEPGANRQSCKIIASDGCPYQSCMVPSSLRLMGR